MGIKARYDTAAVAPRDRFAFWREAVCASFVQLGCEADARIDFDGVIDTERHSVLSISHVRGKAHAVERRGSDIRAASGEFFLLSLQTERTSRLSQFGRSALLRSGDMALYDSTHPYRLQLHEGFSKAVIQVPQDRLLSRLPNARLLAGQHINGQSGIGRLVARSILSFAREIEEGNAAVRELVQDTLVDLIATGLASTAGMSVSLSSPEQAVLLRAKSWVSMHLSVPGLDRDAVSGAMGLSVRRLNAIFARDGSSLSGFIRKQRLEAVARDLTDSRCARLTVSEVAFRNGFSNLQHFSTLFRSYYGMTPTDWRRGRDR